MLISQVHAGLLNETGIDLLAQTHMGLLAAVRIAVDDGEPAFGGGYGPLAEKRKAKRRLLDEDEEILMVIKAIAEVIQ